jgi:predicted transcriptional regulator YdeE/DNA-binding transcriptional MerR regulator
MTLLASRSSLGRDRMLKIGEFSKVAEVSVKTLRYYDDLGLLRPNWVDRYTGYRYYTLQQLPRLNRILALKELGFPLDQIARLLRDDLPPGELQRLMRLRQAELEQQVEAESAAGTRATQLRQMSEAGMRYEVLVNGLPAGSPGVATPSPTKRCGADDSARPLRGTGLSDPSTPCLAIYYDREHPDRGADVEAAVPLEQRIRAGGRLDVHELPGSKAVASAVHQGSYAGLAGAYAALLAWTQANGYRVGGPNLEIYLQGFGSGPDPAGYVTELQLPLEPATASAPNMPEGRKKMEPKIVDKAAFTVVGVPFAGFISHSPYEGGSENNEIGKTWDEFNARAPEIKHVSGPAYGLCFGMPNEKEPWYIAGIEVTRVEDVPPGMMSMSVPAQKYAIFPCTLGTLGATYRYITEEWQPRTGHQHADAPDFELYDEESDPENEKEGKLSVYWPIDS